ncbi:MAG: radical SAM family heme chaperone HemW [Armatimonadota bacterium]
MSISSPLSLPLDHRGLYVHVPFCVRKCRYCDFASQARDLDPSLPDRYLEALAREARLRRDELAGPAGSIFIGGGTPTVLSGDGLRRLWHEAIDLFPRRPDAEVTIEANPGTLNEDVLSAITELPITRVSLGVQSLRDAELRTLGRVHTTREAETSVAALRAAGIRQVNIDLMYGLPGQTAASWEDTLRRALALRPEHLSLYSLMLEEGTPLAEQVAAGLLALPGEEEIEQMTAVTASLLADTGLVLYEVSNAARPGMECRHNLGYWLGRDYLGLGPAATSAIGGLRWRNVDDAATYVRRLAAGESAIVYIERLAAAGQLLERIMLGLRLRDGFTLAEAEAACGCALDALAGDTARVLSAEGLLERSGGVLRLTARGYPLANLVVARLMAALDSSVTGRETALL